MEGCSTGVLHSVDSVDVDRLPFFSTRAGFDDSAGGYGGEPAVAAFSKAIEAACSMANPSAVVQAVEVEVEVEVVVVFDDDIVCAVGLGD